ncbi:hypothetical protein INR49_011280, partial [Caranx melampygus]
MNQRPVYIDGLVQHVEYRLCTTLDLAKTLPMPTNHFRERTRNVGVDTVINGVHMFILDREVAVLTMVTIMICIGAASCVPRELQNLTSGLGDPGLRAQLKDDVEMFLPLAQQPAGGRRRVATNSTTPARSRNEKQSIRAMAGKPPAGSASNEVYRHHGKDRTRCDWPKKYKQISLCSCAVEMECGQTLQEDGAGNKVIKAGGGTGELLVGVLYPKGLCGQLEGRCRIAGVIHYDVFSLCCREKVPDRGLEQRNTVTSAQKMIP